MGSSAEPTYAAVTGGAGFLGSHLCDALVQAGHDVTCIDNFGTGANINLQHVLNHPHFRLISADVNDGIELTEPIDVVYHFAAPTAPTDFLLDPVATMQVASEGTRNALELARTHQARFFLASTSEIYGPPTDEPTKEDQASSINPVTAYGAYYECRRFSESLTAAYRMSYNVETTIARIFNTYGPRMRLDDGRILSRLLRQALCGMPLTVPISGARRRSLCYVDDVVAGITALAQNSYPGPVNIGNPEEVSLFTMARIVKETTGPQSDIAFVDMPTDDSPTRRPDIHVAEELLGWTPQTSIKVGLATTIAWFVNTGDGRGH